MMGNKYNYTVKFKFRKKEFWNNSVTFDNTNSLKNFIEYLILHVKFNLGENLYLEIVEKIVG